MRKTPLYSQHLQLGAKMVSFAGWQMPVQYASIIAEHLNVRQNAGIFDVSHMGKILLQGQRALEFIERLTCAVVAKMGFGQVQYNMLLNEQGGVVDDITIYRLQECEFFIVVNAANFSHVWQHLQRYCQEFGMSDTTAVQFSDETAAWQQVALQGPHAQSILEEVIDQNLAEIRYFHFADLRVTKHKYLMRISRTGYTGEDGFEIYAATDVILWLWQQVLQKGAAQGVQAAGLGARDGLRLEAFYPLYGQELNAEWTPVQSAMAWVVKKKEQPYLGYERIIQHKENAPPGKVIGFRLQESGLARQAYPVWDASRQRQIAQVLSAAYSPILKCGIGTLYLPHELQDTSEVQIKIRDRFVKAALHRGAFVPTSAGKSKT